MNKARARQIVIVFYLVARANRLDDVRARALRAASKLEIQRKDLCACVLDAWGKRYMHHKRALWKGEARGMRRTLS